MYLSYKKITRRVLLNLERSFHPRKTRKALKIFKELSYVICHPKGECFSSCPSCLRGELKYIIPVSYSPEITLNGY